LVNINQKTNLQFRRADEKYWNETNLILKYGEPGYNKDEKSFKIGDGVTPWSQLSYQRKNLLTIY
jgi:hypothetical protein